ncbi:ROK family protein [Streptosporangium sp. NPDC000396]|uniref:ROK family protein n=1 Tax=Streptosporangium sp. NPDC000396 TaxID=3366185 RepID=UPI0036A4A9F1
MVSTGVGGGLVLEGRPFAGPTGDAGHLGHVVVDPGGPPCPYGATGCVETVASGPRWSAGPWARCHPLEVTTPHPPLGEHAVTVLSPCP